MKNNYRLLNFIKGGAVLVGGIAAAILGFYIVVLPWLVSNQGFVSYVETFTSKTLGAEFELDNPKLKTGFVPTIEFGADKISLTKNKKELLNVENLDAKISFAKILNKSIGVNYIKLSHFYSDVNGILDLPILKEQKSQPEQKNDWTVDVFNSVVSVDDAVVLYNLDKSTKLNLMAKDVKIDDNPDKKQVKYSVVADIEKDKSKLHITTTDNGHVFIENKEKFVLENNEIFVNDSKILLRGFIDEKSNFDFSMSSDKFEIPEVISLLESQIVPNNIPELLVYFKDIQGDFDFDFNITNKDMNGNVDLNKLSFKLEPLANLPILLNHGKVTLDSEVVNLKEFRGYYGNKPSNRMNFDGTVKDYLKSVDTDLEGKALVTNDFSANYLSKLVGYPITMKGTADTKVNLKSKYNKIDLNWLFMFEKGNGFVFDGSDSSMNDKASRAMYAKMHFDNTLFNLESLNYYAGDPDNRRKDERIPILSMNGNFDLANGGFAVKDVGFELPKPMPSGFINLLLKEKIFRNGTFTGDMRIINTGKYPVLSGNMKAEKVAIPSQRLLIKNGEFRVDKNLMYINSDGRYRRSAYDLSGTILNEIKFPIVVKNITLNVDEIDVMRYLKLFNAQQAQGSEEVNVALSKVADKGQDIDSDDEADDAQAFDLSNLIIEECILKLGKGSYKLMNFSDVEAKLTLDKNSLLKINSNRFNIAEGISSAKIDCDLKNHKYSVKLGVKDVNSDIIATSLLNLSKEIDGKASGFINLNTDDSLKLNGRMKFIVNNGTIGKVGLVEYIMKVAALFRNPLTMVSPSTISDLVSIPEGRFDKIDVDLMIKDNVVMPMKITSVAPQLSSFIIGTYDLEKQDASLRIYTKFSNSKKGLYGVFRNLSLHSLANRMPLGSRNDSSYYEAEISQLPPIEADEKDCQIFLTKVDGDVEHNNFISSLKKIK